jgi:hypothetical protein
MAKADPKKSKADAKGDKKGKEKKDKDAAAGGPVMSVARHPTVGLYVRRAKGYGGLLAFGAAALLSYQANVPPLQVGLRALAVGVCGFLVAWAASVTVARVLLTAQLRALYDELHPPKVAPSQSTQAPVPPAPAAPGAN